MAKFFTLAARYCELGHLLPTVDSIDLDDDAAIAEAKIVLDGMAKTKSEMDAVLERKS